MSFLYTEKDFTNRKRIRNRKQKCRESIPRKMLNIGELAAK